MDEMPINKQKRLERRAAAEDQNSGLCLSMGGLGSIKLKGRV